MLASLRPARANGAMDAEVGLSNLSHKPTISRFKEFRIFSRHLMDLRDELDQSLGFRQSALHLKQPAVKNMESFMSGSFLKVIYIYVYIYIS